MTRTACVVAGLCAFLALAAGLASTQRSALTTDTPEQLVATYEGLADAILAVKKTEANLVHSILAMNYRHAQTTFARVREKLAAGSDVRAELENLATLIAQLGNEGDAAVAGVRKRLLEGGHHHNAAGEQKGVYDEGFVIVTRDAKRKFLQVGQAIGKMAMKPDLAGLEAQWMIVEKQYQALMAKTGR